MQITLRVLDQVMADDDERHENTGQTAALASRAVVLPSGRAIEVQSAADADVLRFRAPTGECVLTIHLTDAGPVVRLDGFQLRAAGGANIDIGGDLRERVGGTAHRTTLGDTFVEAQHVRLEARPGGIELRANDDVRVTGERVLLNSDDPPMPLTWEEYEARRREREGKVIGPASLVEVDKK